MRHLSRLGQTLLGASLAGVTTLAQASPPSFPPDGGFTALAKNGELVPDSADGEGFPLDAIDLTGSATDASAFVGNRSAHTFLRVRLDGDPRVAAPALRSWGCFYDSDGDLTTYEWSAVVVSGSTEDGVYFRHNLTTDPASTNTAADPAEVTVAFYPGILGANHSRVLPVGNDFLLDWAVDWSDAVGFDPSQAFRIHCETGANDDGVGYDASVDSIEPYELSNGWSDLMRCDSNGCAPTCEGEGAACSVGQGSCEAAGVIICKGGRGMCDAVAGLPVPEACNGRDDDCNGLIDDALPLEGCLCDSGKGRCVDCLSSDDCEAGVCHPDAGVCVACATDVDCGSGYCVANRCVSCVSEADCGGGVCDAATGTCTPEPEGCLTTGCGPGRVCNPSTVVCEDGCVSNSDCGPDSECVARGADDEGTVCMSLTAEGRGVLQCGFSIDPAGVAHVGLFGAILLLLRRRHGRSSRVLGK